MRRFKSPNILMAAEIDRRPEQASLQIRYLRAMAPNRPSESWSGIGDGTYPVTVPNPVAPEVAGMNYYALACNAAGGYASWGLGGVGSEYESMFKAMSGTLAPVAPLVDGEPMRFAGVCVSSRTLDLGRPETPNAFWQSTHGMHWLLEQLHLPSDVILDDELEDLTALKRFPVIVLPDVQCLTEVAAATLTQYVQDGGVLIAIGETGCLDELGMPLPVGRLDALLGVAERSATRGECFVTRTAAFASDNLPEQFQIAGHARLVRSTAEVLATGVIKASWGTKISDRSAEIAAGVTAAITDRAHGAGHAILMAANIGEVFAQIHSRRTRLAMDALLRRYATPPYQVEAPVYVSASVRRQAGRTIVHLFNNHPSMQTLRDDIVDMIWPEDVSPTGPIKVNVPGTFKRASCPTGVAFSSELSGEITVIEVPRIDVHVAIVLE